MGMQRGDYGHVVSNQAALWPHLSARLTFAVLVAGLLADAALGQQAAPPPPEFDSGPYTAKPAFVLNPDRDCTTFLGDPVGRRFNGCYVPMSDEMILPRDCDAAKGKIGSTCRALIRHEEGHARGGLHDDAGVWYRRPPPDQPAPLKAPGGPE